MPGRARGAEVASHLNPPPFQSKSSWTVRDFRLSYRRLQLLILVRNSVQLHHVPRTPNLQFQPSLPPTLCFQGSLFQGPGRHQFVLYLCTLVSMRRPGWSPGRLVRQQPIPSPPTRTKCMRFSNRNTTTSALVRSSCCPLSAMISSFILTHALFPPCRPHFAADYCSAGSPDVSMVRLECQAPGPTASGSTVEQSRCLPACRQRRPRRWLVAARSQLAAESSAVVPGP